MFAAVATVSGFAYPLEFASVRMAADVGYKDTREFTGVKHVLEKVS